MAENKQSSELNYALPQDNEAVREDMTETNKAPKSIKLLWLIVLLFSLVFGTVVILFSDIHNARVNAAQFAVLGELESRLYRAATLINRAQLGEVESVDQLTKFAKNLSVFWPLLGVGGEWQSLQVAPLGGVSHTIWVRAFKLWQETEQYLLQGEEVIDVLNDINKLRSDSLFRMNRLSRFSKQLSTLSESINAGSGSVKALEKLTNIAVSLSFNIDRLGAASVISAADVDALSAEIDGFLTTYTLYTEQRAQFMAVLRGVNTTAESAAIIDSIAAVEGTLELVVEETGRVVSVVDKVSEIRDFYGKAYAALIQIGEELSQISANRRQALTARSTSNLLLVLLYAVALSALFISYFYDRYRKTILYYEMASIQAKEISDDLEESLFQLSKPVNHVAKGDFSIYISTTKMRVVNAIVQPLNAAIEMCREVVSTMRQYVTTVANLEKVAQQEVDQIGRFTESHDRVIHTITTSLDAGLQQIKEIITEVDGRFKAVAEHIAKTMDNMVAARELIRKHNVNKEHVSQALLRLQNVETLGQALLTATDKLGELVEDGNIALLNTAIQAASGHENSNTVAIVADEFQQLADQCSQQMNQIKAHNSQLLAMCRQAATSGKEIESQYVNIDQIIARSNQSVQSLEQTQDAIKVLKDGLRHEFNRLQTSFTSSKKTNLTLVDEHERLKERATAIERIVVSLQTLKRKMDRELNQFVTKQ